MRDRGVHGLIFKGLPSPLNLGPAHLSAVLLDPALQIPFMRGPGLFTSSRWIYNFNTNAHPILLLLRLQLTISLAHLRFQPYYYYFREVPVRSTWVCTLVTHC